MTSEATAHAPVLSPAHARELVDEYAQRLHARLPHSRILYRPDPTGATAVVEVLVVLPDPSFDDVTAAHAAADLPAARSCGAFLAIWVEDARSWSAARLGFIALEG
jgi:hypothetical protein